MESRTYYYARVSSKEQNLDRQIEAFKALGADERNIVSDKDSGINLNRNGYLALRDTILREGDTLVIKSLDRLSRNKADIKNELKYYSDKGIRVKILDLPTTMIDINEGQEYILDLVNNILIEVIGTFAEHERKVIRERQAEGIASAKQKGVRFGRGKIQKPNNWDEVFSDWKAGRITAKKAMELTGLKRTTFYKFAKNTKY